MGYKHYFVAWSAFRCRSKCVSRCTVNTAVQTDDICLWDMYPFCPSSSCVRMSDVPFGWDHNMGKLLLMADSPPISQTKEPLANSVGGFWELSPKQVTFSNSSGGKGQAPQCLWATTWPMQYWKHVPLSGEDVSVSSSQTHINRSSGWLGTSGSKLVQEMCRSKKLQVFLNILQPQDSNFCNGQWASWKFSEALLYVT